MVRTPDPLLIAALNNSTRRPALTLTIEDHTIHYTPYQNPGNPDAWNSACIASDSSIIRVQLPRTAASFSANFQFQRITDPSQPAQWSTWTTLPGSTGLLFQDAGCSVSNSAGTLRAFAQRGTGGNNLWAWTSVNNGLTWTGPLSVLTPPSSALIKGIASAGNNDVFILYDVSGGEAIGCSFNSAGTWSTLSTWTLSPISYGLGLAVAWLNSTYNLVYSDGYGLYSCTFNPTTNLWNSLNAIAPASTASIIRVAPHLSLADGIYTLTCIEQDTGSFTGAIYSYPRLRQSADLIHWSNGLLVHDLSGVYGATAFKLPSPNTGNAGARYYLATPTTVYSAPAYQSSSYAQYLECSSSILSYQRSEQRGQPARLEILLDNAQGIYNAFVASFTATTTYKPIAINSSLILSEGYKTGFSPATNALLKVGNFHITQIRFVRSPYENHLLLIALDLSSNLDLPVRYQNSYSNQTLGYLVSEVCARAGLLSVALPSTSQIHQTVPSFTLQAGQTYRHALNELCATYGLDYFLDQSETMQFLELSSADSSVWTYQPEIESVSFANSSQRANHIIVSGKPPSAGQPALLTTAEAYDDANLHLLGLERLLHHIDPKLTTTAQCSQKATFLLAQQTRIQTIHSVILPLNPALQLLDPIALIDSAAPTGSGQSVTCRIVHLHALYNAQNALAELQLSLEGI